MPVFMDAGSRVEYGVTKSKMNEELTCHPINEYGKAKLEFYQKAAPLCEQLGLTYYHLRFSASMDMATILGRLSLL